MSSAPIPTANSTWTDFYSEFRQELKTQVRAMEVARLSKALPRTS